MKCGHEFGANIRLNKDKFIKFILDRGVNKGCPRCAGCDFEVVNETNLPISYGSITAMMLACAKCYFIMYHAINNECFHEVMFI